MKGKSVVILLVEDEPVHTEAIRRALKATGADVEIQTVGTLREYREAVAANPPDIALMNLNLPDGHAVDVLTSPPEDSPFPILIMTSHGNEQTAVEAIKAGALDYIVKSPEAFAGIPRTVTHALRNWNLFRERKQTMEALRKSELKYRLMVENARDVVLQITPDGILTYVSPIVAAFGGYDFQEEIGQNIGKYFADPFQFEQILVIMAESIEKQQSWSAEFLFQPKDHTPFWVEVVGKPIVENNQVMVLNCIMRDITKRKHAEEELRESEEHYRTLFNEILDGICLADAETGIIIDCNYVLAALVCRERAEIIGQPQTILHPPQDDKTAPSPTFKQHRADKEGQILEAQIVTKTGEIREVEIKANLLNIQGRKLLQGLFHDITERKQVESQRQVALEALGKSESLMRAITDSAQDAILMMDPTGCISFWNPAAEHIFGYTSKKAIGQNLHQFLAPKRYLEAYHAAFPKFKKTGQGEAADKTIELQACRKNGEEFPIELSLSAIHLDDGWHGMGIIRDITERKQAEEVLRESETRFREMFDDAPIGYHELDTEGRVTRINRTELATLGYAAEEILGRHEWEFIDEKDLSRKAVLDKLAGTLPQGLNLERTYCKKDGTRIPVLIQDVLLRDKDGKITGIRTTVQDITERKKVEEKLIDTLDSLRNAVGATIQVMVSAVETRDPYTAGHQTRSADLSRTIATEMGLPQEKIDAIRMAGSIHDIGKLSIPAEILSKPTKLSEIEFSLIKEHARKGFEMLKDVESSWPLAEMVYQHHERMDGSGYPRGLKGGEILIEARILAVSDVVESMASHRPYRAALGLNVALEEIEKNRGTLYDEAVVDICLRLFREKGYRFAER